MTQDLSHNKTAQLNKVQMYSLRLAQQQREALNQLSASFRDIDFGITDFIRSLPSIDRYGSVPSSSPGASMDGLSPQDYQLQLMLLEQHNKKRLLEAGQLAGKV
jgi:hypothetical protein